MPFDQLLSLILLVLVFLLAIGKKLNIGILALAATLPPAVIAGVDAKQVFEFFDGKLVVLIAGVSLLFAHMKESGTLTWLIVKIFDVVGDRVYVLPWAVFILGAALSTAGAFATAPIALLVPMVAYVSSRTRHMFFINELAVIIGANMAGSSPLSPVGALISSIAADHNVSYSKWGVWAVAMVTAVVAVAVLQVIFTATKWGRARANMKPEQVVEGAADDAVERPVYAICSGLALIMFVVCVIAFGWDVGLTAMAMVVILQLVFNPPEKALLKTVPWNAIILLTGLLTYLGVMKHIGTMDSIQHGMLSIGSSALLLATIVYLTTLLCNIEFSTLGVLGLALPIALSSFPGNEHMTWVIAAIAAPAALMVVNPVHVAGTLVVAQVQEDKQNRTFCLLLSLAISMGLIAPLLLLVYPMMVV